MVAAAADYEHHVTPRELFFDLVFVFAFTQVATLIVGIVLFAFAIKTIVALAALALVNAVWARAELRSMRGSS